ncbi:lipopolysaccharide biosynthesis protein [Pseudorhodoferax sp.]|uniref:lipopolysaccharide biosynthesis protein n=1 Tax=Pseudorhodoferax sp. TaxID=1993553 RepID=UPI002DD69285|nr:lipopolysaccharide biosynthesis protein [Pseudorhodoferax sp.]
MSQRKVLLGSLLLVGKRWANRLLSLASTVVLARLLAPQDYGLLALALSVSIVFEVIAQFHFDLALIRKPEVTPDDLNSAWTLNVICNTAVALALAAAAPLLALATRTPELTPVVVCIALCFLFDGLQNIGMVLWRKQMVFTKEVTQELTGKVIEIAVAIGIAFVHPSVWALVGGMMAGRLCTLLMTYLLHPYRPRFSLVQWRGLMGYSGWAMLFNLFNEIGRSADTFILGRMHGLTSVGLFANARTLAALPTTELMLPITRSLFPAFSTLLSEPARLRDAYLKALSGVLLLALPLAIGLVFVADAAVLVLFGPRWLDAVPLVQGLALAQVAMLSGASRVPLLMALGRNRALMVRAAAMMVVRPAVVVASLQWGGLHALPLGIMVVLWITVLIDSALVARALSYGSWLMLKRTWRPYAAVAVMALVLWQALPSAPLHGTIDALQRLLLATFIATPAYLATAFTLWHVSGRPDALERTLFDMLRSRLQRRRTPVPQRGDPPA